MPVTRSTVLRPSCTWQSIAQAPRQLPRTAARRATVELDFSQPWHPAGAGVRRPAAGAVPAGPAVLQGGRSGLLPPTLRHQRHAHPAGPSGGPYPASRQGRGAPARQRGAAQVRHPHHVRPRVLGIDPQHRLLVSPRLRADFSNGDQFYAKQGQVIDLPERRADRPGREFLEWHLDEVFLRTAAS